MGQAQTKRVKPARSRSERQKPTPIAYDEMKMRYMIRFASLLNDVQSLESVYALVVNQARVQVPCDSVAVFTRTRDSKSLILNVLEGDAPSEQRNVCLPVDYSTYVGTCAQTAQPFRTADCRQDSRAPPSAASMLCAPILSKREGGRVVGVLQLTNRRAATGELDADGFTEGDEFALSEIGQLGGAAMSRLMASAATQRERETELRAVMNMVRLVSVDENPRSALSRIAEQGYQAVDCERIIVHQLDAQRKLLTVIAAPDVAMQGHSVEASAHDLVGWAVATSEPVMVQRAYEDPRFDNATDKLTGVVTHNVAVVPILHNGHALGAVEARNKKDGRGFLSSDVESLKMLASVAAVVLRNHDLHAQARVAERTSAAMLKVLKVVAMHEHDVRRLIDAVIDAAYPMLLAERVSLFLVDHVKRELWIAVSKDAAGLRINMGDGIVGAVSQSGELVNVADAYEDPRFNRDTDVSTGYRTKSIVCAPVFADPSSREVVAVLQATNKLGGGRFDEADEVALNAFCTEVGRVLRRNAAEAALLKEVSDSKIDSQHVDTVRRSLLAMYSDSGTREVLERAIDSSRLLSSTRFSHAVVADGFRTWDYDVLAHGREDLVAVACQIFCDAGVVTRLGVSADTVSAFVCAVAQSYRDVPFHRFEHGLHALHAVYLMLDSARLHKFFSRTDVLGLLVAALCHDVDHPGVTNAFESARAVRTGPDGINASSLAVVHGDDAVLERHHAHVTFQLLAVPECNMLATLAPEDLVSCRRTILRSILATDMGQHFSIVAALDALPGPSAEGASSTTADAYFDKRSPAQVHLLADTIIHSADLVAQTLKLDLALAWGERVLDEFAAQATAEVELDLPRSAFMQGLDPDEDGSAEVRLRVQKEFVSSVLLPMWVQVARLVPALAERREQLSRNHHYYEQQLRQLRGSPSDSTLRGDLTPPHMDAPPAVRVVEPGDERSHRETRVLSAKDLPQLESTQSPRDQPRRASRLLNRSRSHDAFTGVVP